MARIEKTVFVSYRRTSVPWALAVYQSLTQHGYDVFFDYKGVASGDFERVILENIRARAHFIVLLTPSALDRTAEPTDWLRREIEVALDTQRNIVPLTIEGFDFGAPAIARHLTGKLSALKHYNALGVPPDYFDEAMSRLRDRYLNIPLESVLHPVSATAREAAKAQQGAAAAAPPVRAAVLTAEKWFERGFEAVDVDEQLRCYTEAIRLKPDYATAYFNRGNVRRAKGDFDGAIEDYTEAIRLKPDDGDGYNNRGIAREAKGDLDGAIEDYTEAIRLKPDDGDGYNNRGIAREAKGDLDGAIEDHTEAIRLKPDDGDGYNNRGIAREAKGDLDGAIEDYTEAIRLKPNYADACSNRGDAREAKGDRDGALKDYTKAIRIEPDHANAHYNRAMVRKKMGEFARAISDYQRYLDLGGGVRDGDQAEVEGIIRELAKKL